MESSEPKIDPNNEKQADEIIKELNRSPIPQWLLDLAERTGLPLDNDRYD